jgi:hypothetical protein
VFIVLPLVAVPVVCVLVALLDPLGVVDCAGTSAAVPSKRAPDRAA